MVTAASSRPKRWTQTGTCCAVPRSGPALGWRYGSATTAPNTKPIPTTTRTGLPYLDGLEIQIVNAPGARAAALRNGLLDLDRSPYESVVDAKSAFPGIESAVYVDPGAGVELIMNTNWKPFDSQEVRTAVLHAINPWTLNQTFWNAQSFPTLGLRVPSPDWLLTQDDIRGAFAKRGEAREVLGAADGDVKLTVGQFDEDYRAQADFIATSLRELGLRTVVEEISTREYGDRVWVGGDYQMAMGAIPPISSLTGALLAVHHSRGGLNTTHHEIPGLDALIESQAIEFNDAPQRAATRNPAAHPRRCIPRQTWQLAPKTGCGGTTSKISHRTWPAARTSSSPGCGWTNRRCRFVCVLPKLPSHSLSVAAIGPELDVRASFHKDIKPLFVVK